MNAFEKNNPFKLDYHLHTEFAYCAEPGLSLPAVMEKITALGLEQVAITEHAEHLYFSLDDCRNGNIFLKAGGIDRARNSEFWRVPQYMEAVNRCRSSRVLLGMEVSADPDGKLYIHGDVLEQLDIVIGSFHWRREYGAEGLVKVTLRLLEAGIDIIGHPFQIFAWHRAEVPDYFYKELARAARRNNVAVELNSHHKQDCALYDEKSLPFLLEEGVKISIGSDAHSIEEIGDYSYQKRLFEEAGLTDKNEIRKCIYRFNKNQITA